jgi:hypothetical protein
VGLLASKGSDADIQPAHDSQPDLWPTGRTDRRLGWRRPVARGHRSSKRPGGDPKGRILQALSAQVPRSLPGSAIVLSQHALPPAWDSCDGRAGTFGWDPVRVVVSVKLDPPLDAASIAPALVAAGWVLVDQLSRAPLHTRWSSSLTTGQRALLDVTGGTADGSFVYVFSAQPPGPVARGC